MQPAQIDVHADMEQAHWWFLGRRRIMRRLVEDLLPPGRNELVLDIGCGTGANLAVLAPDYRCAGLDRSGYAIDLARRRFPEIRFETGGSLETLGETRREIRLILLMDVLEHIGDDRGFLAGLVDEVGPGTHFLITVPADPRLWSWHDESFGHFRRYDRRQLELLWAGLPVRSRLVSCYNSRLYPLIRLIRLINQRLGRTSGAAGTDFKIPPRPFNRLLERVLSGEGKVLAAVLAGRRLTGYRRGVSLIAVLQRL